MGTSPAQFRSSCLSPQLPNENLGCLAFPLAYFLSWTAFCATVEYYWAAKEKHAVTDARMGIWG